MTSDIVNMTRIKHMLSPSSLSSKNNRGTCLQRWGKWNYDYSRLGSTSLLNMALRCFVSGWGHLISFSLASMGLDILFDLSSVHCRHHLIRCSFDVKYCQIRYGAVICSREVVLCHNATSFAISSQTIIPLSRVDDVGIIMAHLRSKSFLVYSGSLSEKET